MSEEPMTRDDLRRLLWRKAREGDVEAMRILWEMDFKPEPRKLSQRPRLVPERGE